MTYEPYPLEERAHRCCTQPKNDQMQPVQVLRHSRYSWNANEWEPLETYWLVFEPLNNLVNASVTLKVIITVLYFHTERSTIKSLFGIVIGALDSDYLDEFQLHKQIRFSFIEIEIVWMFFFNIFIYLSTRLDIWLGRVRLRLLPPKYPLNNFLVYK